MYAETRHDPRFDLPARRVDHEEIVTEVRTVLAAVSVTQPRSSLARLGELALHLRVDAEVVQRPDHDSERDRGRARATGVAAAEVPALRGRDHADDQPHEKEQRS
jgi:hypothetical protein